jgi:hypothetical protein
LFGNKLFRYNEFCIPFEAYRAGDLTRDEFLEIILELKDIQEKQHDALLDQIDSDTFLRENHGQLYENLQEVTRMFDEAIYITEDALLGPVEEEEDFFEDALDVFKRGNILLSEAFYDIDELWERGDIKGFL